MRHLHLNSSRRQGVLLLFAGSFLAVNAFAQAVDDRAGGPTGVKAESVTINMPESMTKDQADAILTELRQIRQLLERQNAQAPQPAVAPAQSDTVAMTVDPSWHALGRADAPITIVEFSDYQCPFCRRFETDSFEQLKKKFIDTGKVRFVSRDLPLAFHPNAMPAALAVHCAGEQNRFWEMHDAILRDTAADLSRDSILKYGDSLKLDKSRFSACLDAKKYAPEIQKDMADAAKAGISGTPSFVIGKAENGKIEGNRVVGALPYSSFESQINQLLSK